MHSLAIVIPAYKLTFLEDALKSISSQANKNFTLYIGDDNSPDDLYAVVKKYEKIINIVYKKFEENLGAITLVAHWNRCVGMIASEKWIWLFSDDDIMRTDCVESFLKAVEKTLSKYDVYRFNCSIIDEAGKEKVAASDYPLIQSSSAFLTSRLSFQFHHYITNAIFSRSVFNKHKGFVNFPAAWAADDATWVLFGEMTGIFTMQQGLVEWRESTINISGNRGSIANRTKKHKGADQFIDWVYQWSYKNKLALSGKLLMNWYFTMITLIGFPNPRNVYLKSRPVRKYFWRKHLLLQASHLLTYKPIKVL